MFRAIFGFVCLVGLGSCGSGTVEIARSARQTQNDISDSLPIDVARRFLTYYGGVDVQKLEQPGVLTIEFKQDGTEIGMYQVQLAAVDANNTSVTTRFERGQEPKLVDDHIDARRAVSGIVSQTFDEAVKRQKASQRMSEAELDRVYTEWTSSHTSEHEAITARIQRSLQGKLR